MKAMYLTAKPSESGNGMSSTPPPSPRPAPLPLGASSLTRCSDLDLSVTHSPAPSSCKLRPQGPTGRKRNAQLRFEEPVVVMVTPEPHIPLSCDAPLQQPVRCWRRNGHHHGEAPNQRAGPQATTSSEPPGAFEGAELNTTLTLKAELQAMQREGFNSQKAVQQTLQKSERTKNLISSRATEGVNVARSQLLFASLVNVSVQEDHLISQALQDRLQLAPPPGNHEHKAADGPSPLLFMTWDMLREKPLPPEEALTCLQLCPSPCPASLTFDLHRRQRRWEAMQ